MDGEMVAGGRSELATARLGGNAGKLSTLFAGGGGVVLDGALATYLETLGADISSALWSASLLQTNPSLIQRAHSTYFAHGAQIATTASYQASLPGLTKHLSITEEEATNLVHESVVLAQRARDEHLSLSSPNAYSADENARQKTLMIAGSVGPYGAYLADGSEYTGAYTLPEPAFQEFHRGRIAALVGAGVDVLAIETIPSFAETRALVALLESEFPDVEAWFSFTLHPDSATRIADGTPVAEVVALLEGHEKVVAVGVNCVAPELALAGLKELRTATEKPLVVYANSGEKWDAQKRDWEGARSGGSELARWTREAWDIGARIVGGCCRTGPKDVEVIAETLREMRGTK